MLRPEIRAAAVLAGTLAMLAPCALARAETRSADAETAATLVQQLDQDTLHRSFIADALAHARAALERAARLRAMDDAAHAAEADALAREWAEIARDRVAAASSEEQAAELRRKASDAQAQLERTRALVEQAIARVGRLRAELTEADRSSRTAVEVHDGSPPPGKKKSDPTKPAPATPPKAQP